MVDEKIIALFLERSEQAIQALDGKYGSTCRKLSYNILHDHRDAEECVNDAYLGVWNAIPPARPNPLLSYLSRVVRNISLKRYYHDRAYKRDSTYDVAMQELEGYLASPDTVEETLETKELARSIEAFLDTLPAVNRVIFLRRYWFADTYGDIARQVGLTEKNVSVRLVRIRKQMREHLLKGGWIV